MLSLSVVVAAQGGGPLLRECLSALAPQLEPGEIEALVVMASGSCAALQAEFPSIQFLSPAGALTVPLLWSIGIRAAHGRLVALTIENCASAPDWAKQMLKAHQAGYSCVGGAIDITPRASLTDWAVYFSRYSGYIPPFPRRFPDDVAGDNCSYDREALDRVEPLMRDGFWETFINQHMRLRNEVIVCDPQPLMIYLGGISARRFFKRRYIHGRYFAARRSLGFTRLERLLRGAGFIMVPAMLLNRIAGRVWKNGRYRSQLLTALPLIVLFLFAWALGEGVGYLLGPAASGPPSRD